MSRERRSRALWDAARAPQASRVDLARAILYEIQPIRFDEVDYSTLVSRTCSAAVGFFYFLCWALPSAATAFINFLRHRSRREWAIAAAVVTYYYAVRYVHHLLDAGPMVIIMTCLFLIFTVGLGDNASGDVSAYSVFNYGFQRLLGSVDVEALVAQHVGGGLGMHQVAAHQHGDRGRPVAAEGGVDAGHGDAGDADDNGQQQQGQNRARRSRKKVRRRNLEARREIERQRQAAAAMGFGDGGEAEIAAMNLLIEDQAAENGGDFGDIDPRNVIIDGDALD